MRQIRHFHAFDSLQNCNKTTATAAWSRDLPVPDGGTFSTVGNPRLRLACSLCLFLASSAKYGSISSASAIFWPLATDMLCQPGDRAREVLAGDQAHQLEEVSVRPALEAAPAAGG